MNPRPLLFNLYCVTVLLLTATTCVGQAQPTPPANATKNAMPSSASAQNSTQTKQTRNPDRRRAAKLYLDASKLYEKGEFEEALRGYMQAVALDPGNANYPLAATVARSHAVTALIQSAAKDRLMGNAEAARATLAHGLELEPGNFQLNQHMYELGDDALLRESRPIYEQGVRTAGGLEPLAPSTELHSFHLRSDQGQIIRQVLKAYGIEANIDSSVRITQARFDLDDADWDAAARVVGMVTSTFLVPLDAHKALVVRDTKENRQQFMRQGMETVYLSGLTKEELTDVGNLAKNVFNVQQAVTEPSAGTITLHAPEMTLNAFNTTMRELLDGRSQVFLEVRMIQLAHTNERNTGVRPPQSMTAVNVYAEEQSLLNANQALVQQIISSGLASPNDPLAILLILAASGQISSSLLTNGGALFGGGKTLSALSPGTATMNLSLNSSDSRELDDLKLRMGDGDDATLRSGTRYPIQTSSFSSLSPSSPAIAGLTGAGTSSALSSLLGSLGSSVPNIPMIEYQDLGLTLKATPKVMRGSDVALKIDMKITALAGSSINGNPILNNRSYSGVVTLKQGETVELISELDKSEMRAISGVPGISEIPGLNDLTGKDTQKSYATLLILITPHVVRGTQAAGHSPMMRIDKGASSQ
jgi:tetratricopeptide (TPR) repeat protein